MITEARNKSANFLRIVTVLKSLRDSGTIDQKEYERAKKYYRKITGADIVITD